MCFLSTFIMITSDRGARLAPAAFVLLLFLFHPLSADGQMFSYGDRPRAVQSVSFAYQIVDFTYQGSSGTNPTFDFSGPAYGVYYTRPNIAASILYGPESDDTSRNLRLLDAAITTWGEIMLAGSETSSRIFLPIGIQSNYRRVAPEGSENSLVDSFNITVLALGAGIGYSSQPGTAVRFEARAMPFIGIALRAFGESTGVSYLTDGDVRVHLPELVDRVGLSVGYTYRAQRWNVNGSDLLIDVEDDLFDYVTGQHLFTFGINF